MKSGTSSMDGALKRTLEQRLAQLKNEYETGESLLAELEAKQTSLRETLLRISGAIQVLEETLAEQDGGEESGSSEISLLHDAEAGGNPRFAA